MREILFRGKRFADGEWIFGSLLVLKRYSSDIDHFFIVPNDCMWFIDPTFAGFEVVPETVGQDSGLRDRNGKWIFEGDIVDGADYCAEDGYGVCSFDDGAFEVGNGNYVGTFHENYYGNDFEVIGNIHDNPELLEGGEQNG